jgi:dienelactone hydrolase
MGLIRLAVLLLAMAAAALSVWRLEAGRSGLAIAPLSVGTTPATVYRLSGDAPAPVVVIAHGFAGSRPLMDSIAITLAQAGYIAVSYDLLGHGRNPVPMSGDVTRIDGTTTLLMGELARVADAALALPGADGRLALVGHSMASDIVVRQAVRDGRVQAVVALSMFSLAVTPDQPRNLLVIAGEWEGMLANQALLALRQSDPAATLGQTVETATGQRRALTAPGVEHVGILFSGTMLAETRGWLNAVFARDAAPPVARRGGWIALLLVSVAAMAWPLAGALRRFRAPVPPVHTGRVAFLMAVIGPAVATPLILWPFDTRFLPVLVADYLALHFALHGGLVLAVLGWRGGLRRSAPLAWVLAVPVALWSIMVFGGVLDRYFASFVPVAGRIPVVVAMAIGAIPFMLADGLLTEGGRAPLWRVVMVRGMALASLGLAVALDFERLFFLLIILPVILVFFFLFGTMGGWVGRATWRPGIAGIGLGVFLGWALGVTFPMFAA